jgi:hypothetical protein
MDPINSQNLTHFDSYVHKFTSPGSYQCGISNVGQNTVTVTNPPNATPQQFDVDLTWDGTQFVISTPSINIKTNDLVHWHNKTKGPYVPPYSIVGSSSGGPTFSSRAMSQHEVYIHFLQLPGDYAYVIAGLQGCKAALNTVASTYFHRRIPCPTNRPL